MSKGLKRAVCIILLLFLLIHLLPFCGYYRFHQCAKSGSFVKIRYDSFQTGERIDISENELYEELNRLLAGLQYRGFSLNWPAISPEDKAAALFLYAENEAAVLMIQNDTCWIVEEYYRIMLSDPTKLYQYLKDNVG